MVFGSPISPMLGGADREQFKTLLTLAAHSCPCKFLVPRPLRSAALDNLGTMSDFFIR